MTGQHEFNPDWTVAPAEFLEEWRERNQLSDNALALIGGGREGWADALRMLAEVEGRRPLGEAHARMLERITQIPARMWLRLEAGYRADLAAGRTDSEAPEGVQL